VALSHHDADACVFVYKQFDTFHAQLFCVRKFEHRTSHGTLPTL